MKLEQNKHKAAWYIILNIYINVKCCINIWRTAMLHSIYSCKKSFLNWKSSTWDYCRFSTQADIWLTCELCKWLSKIALRFNVHCLVSFLRYYYALDFVNPICYTLGIQRKRKVIWISMKSECGLGADYYFGITTFNSAYM